MANNEVAMGRVFEDGIQRRLHTRARQAHQTPEPRGYSLGRGGTDTAAAEDGSTINVTGSGTFVVGESDEVTGGGSWKTVASGGTTANGTYKVTGLVRFDLAPGTFTSLPLLDCIGDATNARPGLALLKVAYSDGAGGDSRS